MTDSFGIERGREYRWFSVLLIVLLLAAAANSPGPATASAQQEAPVH